jgi:8-oxo-dGTP pyrophosphatase MutT (NUDIX family)
MPQNHPAAIPTSCFALVVVQKDDRFLLVQETKHHQSWYLPAGRLEPNETFADAALRETLEESGMRIELNGVITIEMSYHRGTRRIRAVFTGVPDDATPPKSVADVHSLSAAWVHPDELRHLRLRGPDVDPFIRHVLEGGLVHPLSILAAEGAILRSRGSE